MSIYQIVMSGFKWSW